MSKLNIDNNNGVIADNNNGTINITNGASVNDVYLIASSLFRDNFYKLQDIAVQKVNERFEVFLEQFKKELEEKHFDNFMLFENPDTQYALCDCIKAYARYGDDVLLHMLISIMSERLCSDENFKIKVAIDEAIQIMPKIDQESLNYLTIMFATKQVRFILPPDISVVSNHFNKLIDTFPYEKKCSDYLNSLGCFRIDLGSSYSRISKVYGVNEKQLEAQLNPRFKLIHGDYSLSYPAIVLAIVNLKKKRPNTEIKLGTWIN